MVQITSAVPYMDSGKINQPSWLEQLKDRYPDAKYNTIEKAYNLAEKLGTDNKLELGCNCFEHGLQIAAILSDLHADDEVITAALLFSIFDLKLVDKKSLIEQFGLSAYKIIKGAIEIRIIQSTYTESTTEPQADRLRKMLLAMINDVRVVLLKLAISLYALRVSKNLSSSLQKQLANDTMRVYAPLANRLGIGQVKWELEDRAFAILMPDKYKAITKNLNEKRISRELYIRKIIRQLKKELNRVGIKAEISGRVKHIYSIWRKMQSKNLSFDDLFDIQAVRILVPNISNCYSTLGLVHGIWQAIPAEFDDYITHPKANGYRSIHTVVTGPKNKDIEIQLRTFTMHEESEMGVAAHWRYKEGSSHDASFENRLNWLRSLLEWQTELYKDDKKLSAIQSKVVDDRVYVFTPNGDVIDLQKGATILDFAYAVHTQIGHRCRGGKVNGRIATLNTTLNTTDRVEILTGNEVKPSLDWLSGDYLKSAKSKAKVSQWFKVQNREQNIQQGKDNFQKDTNRLHLKSSDLEWIVKRYDLKSIDEIYASLGSGHLGTQQILGALNSRDKKTQPQPIETPLTTQTKPTQADLVIEGVDNVLSHMAGCCHPVVGDSVIGYVTQGRGVSVHRTDCQHLQQLATERQERVVGVTWGANISEKYATNIKIYAKDRPGFLKDITLLLANEKINILNFNTQPNKREQTISLNMAIEVDNLEQIKRIMGLINKTSSVQDVVRT